MSEVSFPITDDERADAFLVEDPLALLIGMLLDQQVPMEWAFRSPFVLADRLGERFDAGAIAAMDPEELVEVFAEKPALHRYPAAMARRTHDLCRHLVEHHGGRAEAVWSGDRPATEVYGAIRALPGFGEEKSRIFLALLAKRFDVRPEGWETCAGPFADDEPRSAADVSSKQALEAVREWKKAQKAAKRSKSDPPARSSS